MKSNISALNEVDSKAMSIGELKNMPLLTISSPETIKKCSNLNLSPTDIFICSHPKSGTTWTQHIVISLLLLHRKLKSHKNDHGNNRDEDSSEISYNHVSDYAPFFEIDQHWKNEDDDDSNEMIDSIQEKQHVLGRRIFNTHLRCDMLPKTKNNSNTSNLLRGRHHDSNSMAPKFVYVIRSPLDTCVSFYCHLSNQVEGCYEKSLDAFFNEWTNGDIPYGTWVDHVLSYLPEIAAYEESKLENSSTPTSKTTTSDAKNILLLSYEDMVCDLETAIHEIVEFLELDDVISSKHVDDILPSFSFNGMKANIDRFQPKSVTWKNDFKFLRKGVVGDSKKVLSEEQVSKFYEGLDSKEFCKKVEYIFKNVPDKMDKILKLCNTD